jgi:hypothetical protein
LTPDYEKTNNCQHVTELFVRKLRGKSFSLIFLTLFSIPECPHLYFYPKQEEYKKYVRRYCAGRLKVNQQKSERARRVSDAERERGKLEKAAYEGGSSGGDTNCSMRYRSSKLAFTKAGARGAIQKKSQKKRLMTAGAWSRTWGATHKIQHQKAVYEGGSLGGATYCSTRYLSSKLAARHVPSRSRTSTYINIVKHVNS